MRILFSARGWALFAAALLFLPGTAEVRAQGATYQIVAFSGQPAPGGEMFTEFAAPRIGADGTIAFVERGFRGEGYAPLVIAGRPGALRLVARSGEEPPSLKGGEFSNFTNVSVSATGRVAFNGEAYKDSYIRGIWSETGAGLVLDAVEVTEPSRGEELEIATLGPVGFRSGSAVAKGRIHDSQYESLGALLAGPAGGMTDVLRDREIVDGRRVQEIFESSDYYPESVGPLADSNEAGAVAIKVAAAAGPSPTPYPSGVILAGKPGALKPVASQYSEVPGMEGVEFGHLSPKPSIASNGVVAFSSQLNSEGGPGSAIFSTRTGQPRAIVLEEARVPTTTDVIFGTLSDAVINSTGDVIFRARIWYPNENSREGIWIKRLSGPPVLLAISGMTLPTPSGPQEVTSVDFAGPGTFNDLHQFVFRATFAEEEGIYIADTRPGAPEVFVQRPRRPRDFVTTDGSVQVSGLATDDTGVAKVEYTVAREVGPKKKNGKSANKKKRKMIVSRVAQAKGDRNWNFKVPLSMGLNLISITATDRLGNVSEPYKIRMLRYKAEK